MREQGYDQAFEEAITTAQLIRDRGDSCWLIGAGSCSLVAYLTDLSKIDPIQHSLPFERFLNASQGRTVHFIFVATTPTITEREAALLKSKAVTVHPATTLEALPCLVARRVRRQHSGIWLNPIAWGDPAAFALLQSGDIEGINQLDGTELKELLPALKPRSLIDIAAITAMYQGGVHQPGLIARYISRASGEAARRPNGIVEETLRETRGLILFQEQVMLLLNRLADIPLAEGYAFVRAVSKRNWKQIGTFAERFMAEADKATLEEWDSRELFETIREAAAWAVCKSHHLAQAVTTYQAAYLKAHHPDEFHRELKLVRH